MHGSRPVRLRTGVHWRRKRANSCGRPLPGRMRRPGENLAALAQRLFGPANGTELDIPPRGCSPGRDPPAFAGAAHEQAD
jgi:hypothetical protein